ncbi:bifunctional phosphopantothenoylcysteine decarboxylase/phosphopantothenate synthase [Arcanobacterium bovis]|uniref:Coenzyme A biosynthesis bifunctional protein CoaBC n=2 Tax=Arcanobacterium bovis TaxID=2529275 RepID=A0A4V2KR94_9ACTO|nr:bifunctional phosphopantothenoylcysteine decarboxylase/phosphopantothenate synthase [Arcanobacterium bovis]
MGGLSHIRSKNIVVGVTGGIAAYKSAHLVRLFKKAGHNVRVVPTHAALKMVGKTTFEALSGNPVYVDVEECAYDVVHVNTGQQADLVVIAPATAHTLAKLATGLADNLLTATALVATCPIVVAPAMHTEMWNNAATQKNISVLAERGFRFVGPVEGALTGPDSGIGRMSEPEEIFDVCHEILTETQPQLVHDTHGVSGKAEQRSETDGDTALRGTDGRSASYEVAENNSLRGKTVAISGGGTREPIDSVRYISNKSSGAMAVALANAAAAAGAQVILVAANIEDFRLRDLAPVVTVRNVSTARELEAQMKDLAGRADVIMMAAAVSDYRIENPSSAKIKRSSDTLTLELVKNPDILAELAQNRQRSGQIIVGFAAETGDDTTDYLTFGKEKARRKNADLLAINLVGETRGFGDVATMLTVVDRDGAVQGEFSGDKVQVAHELIVVIASLANGE